MDASFEVFGQERGLSRGWFIKGGLNGFEQLEGNFTKKTSMNFIISPGEKNRVTWFASGEFFERPIVEKLGFAWRDAFRFSYGPS